MNITTRDCPRRVPWEHGTTMSIEELVEHLDRNHSPTACGAARDVDGRHIVKVDPAIEFCEPKVGRVQN